ncbi:MAG: monovalent cation/H+ antiporter complex subunit F [Austwickia sp.]|nr:hypothetical protein [Actinomycetota bacterium]MCB1253449.1 sodium:proton antiporter [Austwickia sp.]MCO5310369.1 monovalent cation/H+ antiporter complex subunit F [Austwickia sp.]
MSPVVATLGYSLLGIATLLTLIRIARGPSVLDRAVGAEVLVAIVICTVGLDAVLGRHADTLPILVSLSLLGFLGSVAIVRLVPRDVDPGRSPVGGAGAGGVEAGAAEDREEPR